jgi:hypothetical protein
MILLNVRTNLRKSLSLGPHENPNLHPKLPDIALKRDAPFRGGFVESDTATVFLSLSAWFCASAYKFAQFRFLYLSLVKKHQKRNFKGSFKF